MERSPEEPEPKAVGKHGGTADTELEGRGTRNAELGTARAKLHSGVSQPTPSHFSSPKVFAAQQEKERLFCGWVKVERAKRSFVTVCLKVCASFMHFCVRVGLQPVCLHQLKTEGGEKLMRAF
jgi:hypothetical protein